MRFAVIGTGNIVERFIAAGRLCSGFELYAVCSRSMERAQAFAARFGAQAAFDSVQALAACAEVDAVYIASPNYAHCAQSIAMLSAGKHVLCEKPLASNTDEVRRMQSCAAEHGVILLEAMKSVFEPSFARLREALNRIEKLRKVHLTYCQYSSRYDQFKNGEILNAFRPELSNGALMDIGVYCVHPAVLLFGMPKGIHASATKLHNGVDGAGTILMEYDEFSVTAEYSKISDGVAPSEFQGENGSLLVEHINIPQELTLCLRGKEREELFTVREMNSMRFEIDAFIETVEKELNIDLHTRASLDAARVMEEARRQIGIVFPADCRESKESKLV